MHLDFLYDYFSAYEMKLCNELKVECLYIRNLDYSEPIKIYYELDDYKTYTLWFATQHLHITTKDELIETISNFANGSIAAIEFTITEKIVLADKSIRNVFPISHTIPCENISDIRMLISAI